MLDAARRRCRPLASALLCGLIAVLPAGCASDRSPGVGEEGRTLRVDDEAFAQIGFRRDWTGFPILSPGQRLREMRPTERVVLVQETGSIVTALDPATGGVRWQAEIAGPLTRFVSVLLAEYRGRPAVLVSSETEIYVLEVDTGNLIGRESLARIATTGPEIVGRTAVFGTARGEVIGHTLVIAARAWGFDMNGPIESGPVLFGGRVVAAAAQSGEVAFLDATSGTLYGRGRMHAGAVVPPAVGDNAVYFASTDQSLYAFDPTSGREIWRFRTSRPLRWEPAFYDGTVYAQTGDQGFVALDAATGRPRWTNDRISGGRLVGVTDGRLLVFNGREAFLLSPDNGGILSNANLGNVADLQMFPFEDGDLFAMGRAGGVAKLVERF